MLRRATRVFVIGFFLTATPAAAWAQVHLQLLGGVTSAANKEPFFGGGIGARLSFIEIDVEVGRFNDVLAKGILEALNDLQREKGLPVQGIASVPATYAMGGIRIIPGVGPFKVFVQAGGGIARLQPRIDIVVEGINLGDIFGLTSFGERTEPMGMAGAGIRLGNKAHVELGYRWVVIFTDFKGFNLNNRVLTYVNAVYGAVGVGF